MTLSKALLSKAVDCALLVHSCKYLIWFDYFLRQVCPVRVFICVPNRTGIEPGAVHVAHLSDGRQASPPAQLYEEMHERDEFLNTIARSNEIRLRSENKTFIRLATYTAHRAARN